MGFWVGVVGRQALGRPICFSSGIKVVSRSKKRGGGEEGDWGGRRGRGGGKGEQAQFCVLTDSTVLDRRW